MMTREEEMKSICDGVFEYWKKYPDYRFWQLMINVAEESDRDIWYLDDEDCLKLFEKHFSRDWYE